MYIVFPNVAASDGCACIHRHDVLHNANYSGLLLVSFVLTANHVSFKKMSPDLRDCIPLTLRYANSINLLKCRVNRVLSFKTWGINILDMNLLDSSAEVIFKNKKY